MRQFARSCIRPWKQKAKNDQFRVSMWLVELVFMLYFIRGPLQTILNEEMTCTAMRTIIKFNEDSNSANTINIENHICEIIARLVWYKRTQSCWSYCFQHRWDIEKLPSQRLIYTYLPHPHNTASKKHTKVSDLKAVAQCKSYGGFTLGSNPLVESKTSPPRNLH